MRLALLLVAPLVVSFSGSAFAQPMSSPAPMASGTMMEPAAATVTLVPQNGSNETGTVTLTQTKAGVVVTLTTDAAPDAPQPAHIHKGSCAKLDPVPAYPLTMVTKAETMGNPKGVSTTTLTGVTLAELESGSYAINVHKSAAEAKIYVACGDIKMPA